MPRINNQEILKAMISDYFIQGVDRPWEPVDDDWFRGRYLSYYFPKKGEVGTICAQYYKAMAKHSTYLWKGWGYSMLQMIQGDGWYYDGHSDVIKWRHSYIQGHQARPWLFVASHFAPYSIREGYEMLEWLRDSKALVIFAVTPYLAKQLVKLGYTVVDHKPQWFDGQYIMKTVCTNQPNHYKALKERIVGIIGEVM